MANVLLLTNTLGASAEVLPALGLLQHNVKILPAEASVLVDVPEMQVLLIDARRDTPREGGTALTQTIADVARELMAAYSVESVGISAAGFAVAFCLIG